ncbi:hypothetical protein [Flavobacterium salmonis]|uniref:Uncharacterized protein n=1 Tax=Flavobacterium salmonis TaxID=2654844 RepID=A0A6V6YS50_9FLAO|nr:hypothetical protein [Flavobacterium salmonis]CAD0002311.1 hypothetical protein FLAT13_01047 [Flavobacterium salmonis]
MLNRYKTHQKILTHLKDEYKKHNQENLDLYAFNSEKIAAKVNFTITKVEAALYELKELNLVDFRKDGEKFKISDSGIAKEKTNFYREKQYDYVVARLKDLALFTTSILAIFSFMITIYKISSDNFESKELKKRINYLELKLEKQKSINKTGK